VVRAAAAVAKPKGAVPVATIVAVLAALFGPKVGGVSVNTIATYVAAVLAGATAVIHAPTVKKTVKKVKPKPKPKPPPRSAARLPLFGLDWAWGNLPVSALHTIGAHFACRYLSDDPSKNLSPAESKRLHAGGILRVVVWETYGQRALAGRLAGIEDARAALAQARACGLPGDGLPWCIYFGVDFPATGPDVEPYFTGVQSELGAGHAGVYGGIAPVRYLLDKGLVKYAWQTYAWSSGQWEPRAQLLQFSNGHTVAGVGCDFGAF
jgi:hypothetical protein